MKSVGVDIEDISRFENKSNAFLEKIFTKNELEYCLSQKKYQEKLCARFCA